MVGFLGEIGMGIPNSAVKQEEESAVETNIVNSMFV